MDSSESKSMPVVTTLEEVQNFLYREARLLDERAFEDWIGLFTDDGTYWIPTKPDQADPYERASIMYDDKYTMTVRVRRLRGDFTHSQAPKSRTVHMVSNIELDTAGGDDAGLTVHACFLMVEYRAERVINYAGRYIYRLVETAGGLRIQKKTVLLVNSDAAHPIMSIYI